MGLEPLSTFSKQGKGLSSVLKTEINLTTVLFSFSGCRTQKEHAFRRTGLAISLDCTRHAFHVSSRMPLVAEPSTSESSEQCV